MPEHDTIKIGYTRLEIIVSGRAQVDFWDYPEEMLRMPFWRIYYPQSNNGIMVYQGREIPLKPGNVYVIAPETPFSSHKGDGVLDKLVIHFSLEEEYCNCRNRIFVFPADPVLAGLGDHLGRAIDINVRSIDSVMSSMAFCSAAVSRMPSELFVPLEIIDPNLLEIRRMIQRAPCEEYTNSDLAKMAGVNVSVFVRRFTAAFGVAPQHFIIEERIKTAASLLLHSRLSIDEIAERTGFCDRYYFTRVFRKFRYISPAKFRRGQTW